MIIGLSAATAAVAATGAVSSFAWFATNNTVTATGMKVKIQSATTLLIDTSNTTNSTNGRLAGGASTKSLASDTDTIVSPVSTVDGTKWFSAKAKEADDGSAIDNSYEDVTNSKNNYCLANTVYLQAFDAAKTAGDNVIPVSNIVIDSITVSYVTGDALNASFRVLTVIGENKVFCGPTSALEPTNKGVASVTDGAATKNEIIYADVTAVGSDGKATIESNNVLVKGVTYNTVYTANIYLYFDGEDEACKTDNIPDVDNLKNYTVTVSFSLVNAA